MTRDEILALSDERLRATGWAVSYLHGAADHRFIDDDGYVVLGGERVLTPDYLHDIAATWKLADSLSQLVITKLIGRWKVEWFTGVVGMEVEDASVTRALVIAYVMDRELKT